MTSLVGKLMWHYRPCSNASVTADDSHRKTTRRMKHYTLLIHTAHCITECRTALRVLLKVS